MLIINLKEFNKCLVYWLSVVLFAMKQRERAKDLLKYIHVSSAQRSYQMLQATQLLSYVFVRCTLESTPTWLRGPTLARCINSLLRG